MPLLLKTDINKKVNLNIRGRVARVGGTVDQLFNYRHCRVEDINLLDAGFGRVARHSSLCDIKQAIKIIFRYAYQEYCYALRGPAVPRDRKTIIMDMHQAIKHHEMMGRYDAFISSNVLEHSPDPVGLLLNCYFITKEAGHQYHAIPHYKYTYDKFRLPTSIDHFIDDFVNGSDANDHSHDQDYIQSAIEKHGWQKEFHKKYPVQYPYIHFHVFDENNTRELMGLMFSEVSADVLLEERFSDNVVIFKNTLNPQFVSKYSRIILARYSPLARRI